MKLTTTTILIAFAATVAAMFSWAADGWVQEVNQRIRTHDHRLNEHESKMQLIGTSTTIQWDETKRRLESVERKLDKLLDFYSEHGKWENSGNGPERRRS